MILFLLLIDKKGNKNQGGTYNKMQKARAFIAPNHNHKLKNKIKYLNTM